MGTNKEDRIRQRAHAIWEREGKPHGADTRHWEQAAAEIEAEEAGSEVPPPKSKKAGPSARKATGDKRATAEQTKSAPKSKRKPAQPK
jgi:hypothetical protein